MSIVQLHLLAGWVGILLGFVIGATIGMRFHRESWLGGYGAFPRRLVRLGHISFIGLGFVNIAFALSLSTISIETPFLQISSSGFLMGAATMPVCCFLTAYKERLRYLFPIPVISLLIGVISMLFGWGVK